MPRPTREELEDMLIDVFGSPLSLHQRDLLLILVDHAPCTSAELVPLFYGEGVEPTRKLLTVIRILISRIRAILEPYNWTVTRGAGGKTTGGVASVAVYDLVRVKRKKGNRK